MVGCIKPIAAGKVEEVRECTLLRWWRIRTQRKPLARLAILEVTLGSGVNSASSSRLQKRPQFFWPSASLFRRFPPSSAKFKRLIEGKDVARFQTESFTYVREM